MKCPNCKFENPDGLKYCGKCGQEIHPSCMYCGFTNPPDFKFCGKCGCELSSGERAKIHISHQLEEIPISESQQSEKANYGPDSERKWVTAMFSDLSGYTEISEKLDPEEVKEITSTIFSKIAEIIENYDGFIEKYIGDAILAVFGAVETFEDSALRAVMAARDIHSYVESVSPEFEKFIDHPLRMHSGINTGLVVTGEINFQRGTHGLVGDTLNTAARLMAVSPPGEIIIDHDTFVQTEGYFEYEKMDPFVAKGKSEPIRIYKVLNILPEPLKLHRLHGLRADLIGRVVEMKVLKESIERLYKGEGSILTICGSAGTGKSRLIYDFKNSLDLETITWHEGNAYPYTQNIPYSPLIDILSKSFRIEEEDKESELREKIESGLITLLGVNTNSIPYIGGLFSIKYPEAEEASPDFWKLKLHDSILDVVRSLIAGGPTIICIEDLHWSDPSFLELIRKILSKIIGPVLIICTYRPVISLFTDLQAKALKLTYKDIRLHELSPTETQRMVSSLLKADIIPMDLQEFVHDKIEGNPFYIEELINSLIESESLIFKDSTWKIVKPISGGNIPSTIHGVVSARLDRLASGSKRVLQEASVIGRAFLYEILKGITESHSQIDRCLSGLERLDFITTRSIQPELEYIFKHALTQEVVYHGLIKKERMAIHERIGKVMENVFKDRLPEIYETLAYHFQNSESTPKAIEYLIKSGNKSLEKFSLVEADHYYAEAFKIISGKGVNSEKEKDLLIGLIIKWAYVFYYRGNFRELEKLLVSHVKDAENLNDKSKLGMIYVWLGSSLYLREKIHSSYQYLIKAVELGEHISNVMVVGYACSWLTWICAELGYLHEGVDYAGKAERISRNFPKDHFLYFNSISGLGYLSFWMGNVKRVFEVGNALIEYSKNCSDIRSHARGYWNLGLAYYLDDDIASAIDCSEQSIKISKDPYYILLPKLLLGSLYIYDGKHQKAVNVLNEVVDTSEELGVQAFVTFAKSYLGVALIANGHLEPGLKMINAALKLHLQNNRKTVYAHFEHVLGKVYLQMIERAKPVTLATVAKNVVQNFPDMELQTDESEYHFNKAVSAAKEIGANGILSLVYYDLGILNKSKQRFDLAKDYLLKAIKLFEKCETENYLQEAKKVLDTLR